jgi:hypothetical protein
MLMLVFWVVTPCGLLGRYQRFRGTYCLHLQPMKCWYLPTSPHGVTTQKTNTDIFTAVRISNLVMHSLHDVHNMNTYKADCVCPSTYLNLRTDGQILMKLDMIIMPLEAIPNSNFLISSNW